MSHPRLRFVQEQELDPEKKAALEYADLFKAGDAPIDSDAVYDNLRRHFSEEEIIELGMLRAQTVGVGRFVRSLNILSWEEACALNPALENA
jgi:alkylhydroperoxidase family enzyme